MSLANVRLNPLSGLGCGWMVDPTGAIHIPPLPLHLIGKTVTCFLEEGKTCEHGFFFSKSYSAAQQVADSRRGNGGRP